MIQKKICMVGTFAVGKTSLVRQFVDSVYSDKYHTTVGVKVDKKIVTVGEQEVTLVLWDIEGAETGYELRQSYLRGAAGYLLVADGTRPDTIANAEILQARAEGRHKLPPQRRNRFLAGHWHHRVQSGRRPVELLQRSWGQLCTELLYPSNTACGSLWLGFLWAG